MAQARRLLVVGVLLASACAGAVMSRVLIPPAHAAVSQRWEHLCFSDGLYPNAEVAEKALNDAGKEGWELAATAGSNGQIFCMKRPAP
jgi:hypothetical protein